MGKCKGGQRARRKRKVKDPSAPKQPLSSYFEFCKVERPNLVATSGQMSVSEIGKELGKRWRELTPSEKELYELKAKENRLQYEEEVLKRRESSSFPPETSKESNQDDSDVPVDSGNISIDGVESESSERNISLLDIGFAQQRKYPWHPAWKTGEMANGSRIKVTYFGTGQTGIVDKTKWVVYSEQAESRIKTVHLMKNAAFRLGLQQMKEYVIKLQTNPGSQVSSPRIDFIPQNEKRKFISINKDHLQKEDEENVRLMSLKMRQDANSEWYCQDCSYRGKYAHKAKAHARICGQRKRCNPKKRHKS